MRYVVEFIQTDPPGSPTPGLGHYAGEMVLGDLATCLVVADLVKGKPVPAGFYYPCCEWQQQSTPVCCTRIVQQDGPDNEEVAEWCAKANEWRPLVAQSETEQQEVQS